jgi:hypothetical protein
MTLNYYAFSMSSAFRLIGQSPDAERAGDRKLTRAGLRCCKLSSDCGGFGKRNPAFPPIMTSWDLSALEAAQQRSFIFSATVWQPHMMASDAVGKERSKLFAKS